MPRHVKVAGRLISVAISPRWLRSLILPWDVYYRKCGAKISPLPLNKELGKGSTGLKLNSLRVSTAIRLGKIRAFA